METVLLQFDRWYGKMAFTIRRAEARGGLTLQVALICPPPDFPIWSIDSIVNNIYFLYSFYLL
jgi:hypothetical protein